MLKALVLAVSMAASTASAATIVDILNLPAQNRAHLLKKSDVKMYNQARDIAFSAGQTMGMRWKALGAMAEMKGAEATGDLMQASRHREWFMRNAALLALQDINPFESRSLALKLLKDPALVVRSAAVEVLGKQMDLDVREALWKEMEATYNYSKEQSLWVRPQILNILARAPLAHERGLFAKALQDRDVRMHEPAIRGLEKLTGAGIVKDQMDRKKAVSLWQEHLKKTTN